MYITIRLNLPNKLNEIKQETVDLFLSIIYVTQNIDLCFQLLIYISMPS